MDLYLQIMANSYTPEQIQAIKDYIEWYDSYLADKDTLLREFLENKQKPTKNVVSDNDNLNSFSLEL